MTRRPHDCPLCRHGRPVLGVSVCTVPRVGGHVPDPVTRWLDAPGAATDAEGLPEDAPRCPGFVGRS